MEYIKPILYTFILTLGYAVAGFALQNDVMLHCNDRECLQWECTDNPDQGTHCIDMAGSPPSCAMDACSGC